MISTIFGAFGFSRLDLVGVVGLLTGLFSFHLFFSSLSWLLLDLGEEISTIITFREFVCAVTRVWNRTFHAGLSRYTGMCMFFLDHAGMFIASISL